MKTGLNGIVVIDIKGMKELQECGLDFGSGFSSEGVVSMSNKEDVQEEFTPFGRDDLEDIISDLQDEYYRLAISKDVLLKIKIADLIDRLCQLRKTMKE